MSFAECFGVSVHTFGCCRKQFPVRGASHCMNVDCNALFVALEPLDSGHSLAAERSFPNSNGCIACEALGLCTDSQPNVYIPLLFSAVSFGALPDISIVFFYSVCTAEAPIR